MYKLNLDDLIVKNFLKFAWFLTKQDLEIDNANMGEALTISGFRKNNF